MLVKRIIVVWILRYHPAKDDTSLSFIFWSLVRGRTRDIYVMDRARTYAWRKQYQRIEIYYNFFRLNPAVWFYF
jgi:hypothetical protein